MSSILYIPSDNGMEERFNEVLGQAMPKKRFEICHTVHELSSLLRDPWSMVRVAVLFVSSKEGIDEILSLGRLLEDVKSILVFAYDDPEMVLKAHSLRPRYITWLDSDFRNVAGVLKRMVALYDPPPEGSGKVDGRGGSRQAKTGFMG